MVTLPFYDEERRPEESGGGCGGCEARGGDAPKCGNGLEKIYRTTAVRYGYMKHVGEFTYPDGMRFTCGAKVVIQTRRGIEIGEQVSLSCSGCDKHVSREQIKTYVENSGSDSYTLENGRIHREATPDDLAEAMRLRDKTLEMRTFAQRNADDAIGRDKMKIVECEYLLGGERAIFYFMAEGRVDFRSLVRNLSHEFQTRIQMHQVGARDEARLLADFETCGREVCCKVFLKTLKPISMRMAKLQRSTLDPSKVSGRCGRLKCCLRYEHDSYETLDARLPKNGEKIRTAHGYGTVVKRQILTQLVQIDQADGGGLTTVVLEDVLERRLASFPPEATQRPPETQGKRPGAESRRPAGGRSRRRPQSSAAQETTSTEPKSESGARRRRRPDAPASPRTESGSAAGEGPRATPPSRGGGRRRRGRKRRRRGGGEGPASAGGQRGPTPPTE